MYKMDLIPHGSKTALPVLVNRRGSTEHVRVTREGKVELDGVGAEGVR